MLIYRGDFMTCNSSSGDEHLRIPWNWESESAVVLAGVPHRRTPPSSKYKERVRDKFSGKRELVHRSLPVVNVPL
ncbi:hypothetical protein CDL15_Pgr001054 [Punica granatum]|uniref:Uncharacterized protein n=1 Tax=Punica granatum TaxID=22663 RepID=A0A218X085_PUNGR|nr:hypothetical protein CDL15_Pgr001054 [Punica granatum]